MNLLLATAISTGIFSGLWYILSVYFGLISWVGFLGATTFFASPEEGLKGLGLSIVTNLSGVFWAMVIMALSSLTNHLSITFIITAIVAFLMCIQAHKSYFKFIPGTFIGSCAIFAAEGNWKIVIPSLILGTLFGFIMKYSGVWLSKFTGTFSSDSKAL